MNLSNLSDLSNLSMLCDFYEFTMSNAYLKNGFHKKNVCFDMFFRQVPDGGGFAIAAGLNQLVDYINQLKFDEGDIAFLRRKNLFDEAFLKYLSSFRFSGDIYAVPEGTPVFPNEPLVTVRAPAIEAQLIETFLLLAINHSSLIATKANRIVRAAKGRAVLEFGARRAHGAHAALAGARAAYIGGCHGTSCTLSEKLYGVPSGGTMAHSWIQMFDSEYDAFETYCENYPNSATLLLDTYNTLKSGLPNAIAAFKKILVPRGITNFAVRLDSGDLAYLSKEVRRRLDEAGLNSCKIVASNSLDEYIIGDLISQGAAIDVFGVGERLITAKSDATFGGVYKLVAVEGSSGEIIPKIKVSENISKITTPHFKKAYRYFDKQTGKALADELCVYDEAVDDTIPRTIFDPEATWKTKTLTDFTAKPLLMPIFLNGRQVYMPPSIEKTRAYCKTQVDSLWDEVKRFENPHTYYVDLSKKLWDIKQQLLNKQTEEKGENLKI
ncbi:MAG: nicotinate phosphoribosyltransferase [Oscillospiraceae bacterium]|nr:nicotinate phosphoribosyltransferase [Oscillospiraceae bacterium]